MLRARDIALVGIYAALLLAVQFALSFVAGVELVTLLTLCFAYAFGYKRALITVNVFCILRCFIFGFFPTVIILYAVYYNLFVLLFAVLGNRLDRKTGVATIILVTALATICTALFTLLDDIITPLFFGFSGEAMLAYFYASLTPMLLQCLCTAVSVGVLFMPLIKIYGHFDPRKKEVR